jgi:hypothetical protein
MLKKTKFYLPKNVENFDKIWFSTFLIHFLFRYKKEKKALSHICGKHIFHIVTFPHPKNKKTRILAFFQCGKLFKPINFYVFVNKKLDYFKAIVLFENYIKTIKIFHVSLFLKFYNICIDTSQ